MAGRPVSPMSSVSGTSVTGSASTRTASNSVTVLMAGWGIKEGGKVKSWRKRYWVLRTRIPEELPSVEDAVTHLLLYFKTKESAATGSRPTGVITLTKGKTRVSEVLRRGSRVVAIAGGCNSKRVYYFLPEDGTSAWLAVLTSLVDPNPLHSDSLRQESLGDTPRIISGVAAGDDDDGFLSDPDEETHLVDGFVAVAERQKLNAMDSTDSSEAFAVAVALARGHGADADALEAAQARWERSTSITTDKVFVGIEHADAIALLSAGSPESTHAVLEAGGALMRSLCRFHAYLTVDVFDPGMWDANGDFDGTRPNAKSLISFQALQRSEAVALVMAVQSAINIHWESSGHAEREGAVLAAIPSTGSTTNVHQPCPPDLQGDSMYNYPPQLSADTLDTFTRAALIVNKWSNGVDPDAYIEDPDIDVVCSTGAPGWGTKIKHAAEGDLLLVQPLDVLYARCVNITKSFHGDMAELFAGKAGTLVVHRPLLPYAEALVKCERFNCDDSWTYLVDVIGVIIIANTMDGLVESANTLIEKWEPISVRNRIRLVPHDIVTLIKYEDVLVEVCFKMADVVALNGLKDAGQTIIQANSENLNALRGQNLCDYPGAVSDRIGDSDRERTSKGASGVIVPLKHAA